jgi:predicted phage baseplate assembly protein
VQSDDGASSWSFRRSLLEALADEAAFTLEDGTWRRVVAYRHDGEDIVHQDYASGAGYTLRFGDGVFGVEPARGTLFRVRYRLGPGALANVPPDTITRFNLFPPAELCPGELEPQMPTAVVSVTNPWPVLDGVAPESASDIKQLTPEAYRADYFFAVRPEDYGTQAEKLAFVQRGNAKLRWTGSWGSIFASADPFGSFQLSSEQFAALEGWLDCVRQAGRDVIVKDPRFRTLDLEITICVEPSAYPGQVAQAVSEALLGRRGPRPRKGFFDPDHFTFGMPLRRSALEAAVQNVAGVRSVQRIRKRERGVLGFAPMTELVVDVAADEVFRLENDPVHPERGSLRIVTVGGA